MPHIKYINPVNTGGKEKVAYTVVKTDGYTGDLAQHPSIVENPDKFVIVDADIPTDAEYLIYTG